jgi:hypothetical protein
VLQEEVVRRGRWLEVTEVLEQAASLYGAFVAGCSGRGSRNVRHWQALAGTASLIWGRCCQLSRLGSVPSGQLDQLELADSLGLPMPRSKREAGHPRP